MPVGTKNRQLVRMGCWQGHGAWGVDTRGSGHLLKVRQLLPHRGISVRGGGHGLLHSRVGVATNNTQGSRVCLYLFIFCEFSGKKKKKEILSIFSIANKIRGKNFVLCFLMCDAQNLRKN